MSKEALVSRWTLLLVAVFVFGGLSWIGGGPAGNAGAWFAVVIASGWPALSGRGCVPRPPNRERP